MRSFNKQLMDEWLAINGELAREDLASKARIKFHTVKRIVAGERKPTELEQTAICKATGLDREALFPTVERKKESVA
jgi:hypothetical protein